MRLRTLCSGISAGTEFSFGIVADGVRRVEISATDGNHPALLGGNAYLWVETEPNTASRDTRRWLNSDGHRRNLFQPIWTSQGIGLAQGRFKGKRDAAVWVSHFGGPTG